jgi:hypothetical protein
VVSNNEATKMEIVVEEKEEETFGIEKKKLTPAE